jgi:Subtilase family
MCRRTARRLLALALVVLVLVPAAGARETDQASPVGLARHDAALIALDGPRGAERLVRSAGGTLVSARLRLWRLTGPAAARLVPRLERMGALRYAEPERERLEGIHFTDPLAQPDIGWHLYAVGAERVEQPAAGFPITIIDSGIDLAHLDFAGRPDVQLLNEQNTDYADLDEYHGTLVSSTAAAATNGVGAEGVYPRAALRVYDVRRPTTTAIVRGLEAAVAAGPSVINLSLGGPIPSRAEQDAINVALRSGSLVVASSGNSYGEGNPTQFPAAFPHVLTVGAVDRALQTAGFSSAGPFVDLVAPGVDIPFSDPVDPDPVRAVTVSGTSLAAPIVAAAAAWVKTVRPDLGPLQLAEVLRRSARDVGTQGFDSRNGFGLLDLPAALVAATPPVDPLEPNDDVDQVVTGRFGRAHASVNGASGRNATLTASLDAAEDPHDVYRLVVPAGTRLVVTVSADANIRADLWSARAISIAAERSLRLAASEGRAAARRQVAWTNRGRRAVAVYLHVEPGGRGLRPRYTAAIRLVRARR